MSGTTEENGMSFNPSQNWKERGLPKPGLKPNDNEVALAERFGVSVRRVRRHDWRILEQCTDDAARRVLLGVTQRRAEGESK